MNMKKVITTLALSVTILSVDIVDSEKTGFVNVRAHLSNGQTCVVKVKEKRLLARDKYEKLVDDLIFKIRAKCLPGSSI